MEEAKRTLRTIGKLVTRFFYWLAVVSFSIGIALMAMNITGLIIPLRNPDVHTFYGDDRKDAVYSYEETMSLINRLPNEDDYAYVVRLTELISDSISPYWLDEGIDRFRLRVPIWENYILWAYSFKTPEKFLKYEYNDYKKALERGVGLCSQYALVASQIMEENGIDSKVVGLSGHVITMAEVNEQWYVVDPEYNVIIPYSLDVVARDPEMIAEYYSTTWAPGFVPELYTTSENNVVFENAVAYKGFNSPRIEKKAYTYKWVLPLFLMIPLLIYWLIVAVIKKSFVFLGKPSTLKKAQPTESQEG